MKFAIAAAALLAVLGVATPVAAQIPTSTQDIVRTTSPPARSEIALTDEVFRDLIECVIRYQGARTRNLLGTIPGTHQEATLLGSFDSRMNSCYDYARNGGRALTFSSELLRGFIAQAYLRRDFPNGVAAATNVTPEAAATWTRPRPGEGRISQIEMLHSTARCVMVRQPATVDTLLRTAPLSAEERAAMRTLQPDLAACLDSGVEFSASRQALRGLLAEAAFHYGAAQRDGFAQPGETAARAE